MFAKYKRILLKLSGNAIAGPDGHGIDAGLIASLAKEIKSVVDLGVEVGIVIGGRNIFHGISAAENGMDRATADYIGMLATIMNGVALHDGLERAGCPARLQTAISMESIAEGYIRRKALHHLNKGRAIVFAGGTGNPFFKTDTTAALRGIEIKAEIILKATNYDGVFNADPAHHPDAKKYDHLSYEAALAKNYECVDATAISLCREHHMPLLVFNFFEPDSLMRIIRGEKIGTLIN